MCCLKSACGERSRSRLFFSQEKLEAKGRILSGTEKGKYADEGEHVCQCGLKSACGERSRSGLFFSQEMLKSKEFMCLYFRAHQGCTP